MGFDIPAHAENRMMQAYRQTPYFRNRFIEWIPIVMALLQFFATCRDSEPSERMQQRIDNRTVRRIKRGGRYSRNVAMSFVRDEHPEMPEDQQEVLAENMSDQWADAPDHEIREMVELSHQVVVN